MDVNNSILHLHLGTPTLQDKANRPSAEMV